MIQTGTTERARPEAIKAVPVRHPGRWIAVAVMLVLIAMFVHLLVTNERFSWNFMVNKMFRPPIIQGLRGTIILTVSSMVIGVVLGVLIAIMRLSTNPLLRTTSWAYTWFFRAVPRLVLLALFGNLGILSIDPGQTEAAAALGMSRSQILRRIVLPQAMRVIVPPTGNETIAMLKDTSLVI